MYSGVFTSVLLTAVAIFGSSSLRAQDATSVDEVMVGVSMQSSRLNTALTKLDQIEKRMRGADASSVGEIAKAGHQFAGAVGEATPVGLLLRHMKYPEDVRFTRAILAISASKAVLVGDTETKVINRYLPKIKAQQAAAESAKIRDAIVATRNLLEVFAHTPELTASASPPRAQAVAELAVARAPAPSLPWHMTASSEASASLRSVRDNWRVPEW
jgi:hypothetical protein